MTEYSGSMTTVDGERIALSPEEANAIWDQIEDARVKRSKDMPDTKSALAALSDARQRLSEMGWRDGIYCPKDGSEFALIQFGSSGIFSAHYTGVWPDGDIQMLDGGYHPHGALWKEFENMTTDEIQHMNECTQNEVRAMERDARAFGAMT